MEGTEEKFFLERLRLQLCSLPKPTALAVPQGGCFPPTGQAPGRALCPLTYQEGSLPHFFVCHLHSWLLENHQGYPDPKCFKNKQAHKETQIETLEGSRNCKSISLFPKTGPTRETRATADEAKGRRDSSPQPWPLPAPRGWGSAPRLTEEDLGAF